MSVRQPDPIVTTGVVAVGGGVGSIARYGLTQVITATPGSLPLAVLLINLVGSLALGALVVVVTELRDAHPLTRPALGTGVLGGFTTFSTFAVQVRGLAATAALTYTLISVVGGIGCALAGMRLARTLDKTFGQGPLPDEQSYPLDPDLP